MLFLSNQDVRQVLTTKMTLDALRQSYTELITGEGVCRPRVDIRLPARDTNQYYQWSTMEGASFTTGYFATRMNSDVRYTENYGGVATSEEYCIRPGLWFGVILLFNIENAEPLALIHDGSLQLARVGADAGVGAELMGREDAEVLGILGSGGMARAYTRAFCAVRKIKKLKVYSPTKDHREQFGREMAEELGLEVLVCDNPGDVYRGVDIFSSCTDGGFVENPNEAAHLGRYLEPGTHITSNWGPLDKDSIDKIDLALILGTVTVPIAHPEWKTHDTIVGYGVPKDDPKYKDYWYFHKRYYDGADGNKFPDEQKTIYMEDLILKNKLGRTSPEQITFSERGNIQGAQFHAIAGRVYEAAKAKGLGTEIPTEWMVEDVRN